MLRVVVIVVTWSVLPFCNIGVRLDVNHIFSKKGMNYQSSK